jgi:hypothetical protein
MINKNSKNNCNLQKIDTNFMPVKLYNFNQIEDSLKDYEINSFDKLKKFLNTRVVRHENYNNSACNISI